jgi:pimeloyl-ACP methyl ester carboxylesterase
MRPVRSARTGRWAASWSRALIASVALAAIASLTLAIPPSATAGAESPALTWRRCSGGFQCSSLSVPLDDATPGRTVRLAVIRARARRPDRRIGSLVVNPGGPGVPAVAFLRSVASSLPDELRDRFDLVAFDPRGVGASDAVHCADSLDPVFDQAFEPTTGAQRDALVGAMRSLAYLCAAHNGYLLAHVSTADAARDLERLRLALGEARLSFLGYSYGTFLGATYAQAYPEHVRAFVLDGPVDPSMSARAVTLAQAAGFEHALDDFLADCSEHPGCAFHHGGDAAAAYDTLRARAARAPLATSGDGGRTLNRTRFDAAVLQQLYLGRSAWPRLADALAAADSGDASMLLAGADAFVGRDDDGRDDHALEAFWAVTCLDGPVVGDVAAAADLERQAVGIAPRLGAFVANNSLPCSVWPVPPVRASGPLTATGAPPILVIGTTDDPATPLPQARRLARDLVHGRLLVAVGEQHTSFDNGNRCVDAAVVHYFVDGTLPRRGVRC